MVGSEKLPFFIIKSHPRNFQGWLYLYCIFSLTVLHDETSITLNVVHLEESLFDKSTSLFSLFILFLY